MAATTGSLIRFSRLSYFLSLLLVTVVSCTLPGCDEKTSSDVATVTIKGKKFHLEIAANDDKRFLGLGKRDSIDDDGGMIFVFPEPMPQEFVMRDCKIAIDIIYLDANGRILSMHAMVPETLRDETTEKADDEAGDKKYNDRLKRYPSRFPSQLVIELKGGKIKELGLTESDKITLDAEGLKKLVH